MYIKHKLTVTALCPVNGQRDFYTMSVETDVQQIYVERILEFTEPFVCERISQEELTKTVARELREAYEDDSIRVVTVGYHSGVKTEVDL